MVGGCAGCEAASSGVLSLTRGELPVDPGVSLMFVMPGDVQSMQVTSVRSPGSFSLQHGKLLTRGE